jgi:environmental stress-induced protein Ves
MRLIQKDANATMLWKNLLGSTRQIDIYPKQAEFSKEDFLWRLSSAEIKNDNSFSIFEKYDRILTLLGPGSIKVDETIIDRNQIYSFRGDQASTCQLLCAHSVKDLGLIYHREKIKAQMRFENSGPDEKNFVTQADSTYVFCESVNLQVNSFQLQQMDCLEIEKSTRVSYQSPQEARFILIEIDRI